MDMHLHPVFVTSLLLLVGVSALTITPDEIYWNRVLPNTHMPKAIKSSLPSAGSFGKTSPFRVSEGPARWNYQRSATREEVNDAITKHGQTFMHETQLAPGTTIQVQLTSPLLNTISTFLPHKVANSIPFSPDKLPEILQLFSVDPKSNEGVAMKNTVEDCRDYCATSLESMVEFVKSELGDRVELLPSTTDDANRGVKTVYKITRVERMAGYGSHVMVCHKEAYPYAVYNCHRLMMAAAYTLTLSSSTNDVAKASVICHKDTSSWNPMILGFQLLKIKPGKTTSLCHFVDDLSVVWTNN